MTDEKDFKVIDGERAYIGPENRVERRREQGHERIERLLVNFGLDRRVKNDRRRKDSSWLLTSKSQGKSAHL